MKNTFAIAIILAVVAACQSNTADEQQSSQAAEHQHHSEVQQESKPEATEQKKPLSPHTSAMAMVGDAHIHIDYSSPRVRNRVIFGGLVAMDEVWVSGAHKATWLETNKALRIAGKTLPAGKYALFTIPGQEQWTVIFNKRWDQHGKDEYIEGEDVFRFKVQPEILEQPQEELTYEVNKKSETEGTISLAWEKKKISFHFEVVQ
ncbi:DUF2911 domain-containing protein [Cesiribacter sp. SM1]|uniref:DUF2911 domain-containing protein n=1 Tax=Cesiribacter sp. SM1 TaxID=2861196 RepID=UPI001CD27394|nr:DUF2911 domain-containing protein [Cesiribacter sp. SM1]